jgi:hypothetical protein
MNLPTMCDVTASQLGVSLSLEQGAGTVLIYHSVTSDGPDGRPWPPPDSNALWVIVRRADRSTLARIPACSSPFRCPRTFAFF